MNPDSVMKIYKVRQMWNRGYSSAREASPIREFKTKQKAVDFIAEHLDDNLDIELIVSRECLKFCTRKHDYFH